MGQFTYNHREFQRIFHDLSTINGACCIIPSCCRAIWPPFLEIWCAMISASDTTSRAARADTNTWQVDWLKGTWSGKKHVYTGMFFPHETSLMIMNTS